MWRRTIESHVDHRRRDGGVRHCCVLPRCLSVRRRLLTSIARYLQRTAARRPPPWIAVQHGRARRRARHLSQRRSACHWGLCSLVCPCARKTIAANCAGRCPHFMPPYIVGLAWVYLGSSSGHGCQHFVGRDLLSAWTYSLAGRGSRTGCGLLPAIDARDRGLHAANRRPSRRGRSDGCITGDGCLRHITLPLAAPGALAAALLIFVLAVSEFGVPGLLRVRVYTTEVLTAFAALYDVTRAIALTMPLLMRVRRSGGRRGNAGGRSPDNDPPRALSVAFGPV